MKGKAGRVWEKNGLDYRESVAREFCKTGKGCGGGRRGEKGKRKNPPGQ